MNLYRFNKTIQDFDTMEEFNDYLEEVEDIIYNIVNNLDTDATKKKISDYKQKNMSSITYNAVRKSVGISRDENKVDLAKSGDPGNNSEKSGKAPIRLEQKQQDNVKKQPTMLFYKPIQEKDLTPEELEKLIATRLKAGGYDNSYPMKRAFEEAFNTLGMKSHNK